MIIEIKAIDTKKQLIDLVIDGWNVRFSELQKKPDVSAGDVRTVVLATGEDLYKAGLTVSDVEASGYRVGDFKQIHSKVIAYKTTADGGSSEMKVNPIQLAALRDANNADHDSILTTIKSDPDIVPKPPMPVASEAHNEVEAPLLPIPQTAATESRDLQQEAYRASISIIEKISPPASLTDIIQQTSTSVLPPPSESALMKGRLFTTPKLETVPEAADNKAIVGGVAEPVPGDPMGELTQMPVRVITPASLPKNTDGPI